MKYYFLKILFQKRRCYLLSKSLISEVSPTQTQYDLIVNGKVLYGKALINVSLGYFFKVLRSTPSLTAFMGSSVDLFSSDTGENYFENKNLKTLEIVLRAYSKWKPSQESVVKFGKKSESLVREPSPSLPPNSVIQKFHSRRCSQERKAPISIAPNGRAVLPGGMRYQHFSPFPSYLVLKLRSGICSQEVGIPFFYPDPRLYLGCSMLRTLRPKSPLPQFTCKAEVQGLRRQVEKIWRYSQLPYPHCFSF